MNNRSLTRNSLSLVVLLLLAAAAPELRAADVRFQLVRDALVLVPVTANDEAPVYFMLDTGADTTIVDTALAKKMGLAPLKQVQQFTVTGKQMVDVGVLAKLAVGGAQAEGLRVLEQDLSGLRHGLDGRIVGILGQNFLSRFNYLVDYRTRRLRIEEADEIRSSMEGEIVPVEVLEHRMIVSAQAGSKGSAKLRLLLDSGANALVLMGKAALAVDCPNLKTKMEMSSAGVAPMHTGWVDLTIAAHVFRDVPVSLIGNALPQSIGDGLLPMALFDRVYVNHAQGYVMLNPRVKTTAELVARMDGE
jgi:predicted aspartyl protease